MKHCYWTYIGEVGQPHKVGLLHGVKTGHLLIYCGSKILVIDFNVRDSKKYSFFINDELCEIELLRKGEEMYYYFHIDKKTDTPRNRARRKLERKHLKQTLLFFGVLIALACAFLVGMSQHSHTNNFKNKGDLLSSEGLESIGRVMLEEVEGAFVIKYIFVANSNSYSAEPKNIEPEPKIFLSHGMPLESGDEFVVEYARTNPSVNEIHFDRPTLKQLDIYKKRAVEKHLALHPNLTKSQATCFVDVAFELKGLTGFADFLFQDVPKEKNLKNNRASYLRLTRDLPFQKKTKERCD